MNRYVLFFLLGIVCWSCVDEGATAQEHLQASLWMSEERTDNAYYDKDLNQSVLLWDFGADTLHLVLPQWDIVKPFLYAVQDARLTLTNIDATTSESEATDDYWLTWEGERFTTLYAKGEDTIRIQWRPLTRYKKGNNQAEFEWLFLNHPYATQEWLKDHPAAIINFTSTGDGVLNLGENASVRTFYWKWYRYGGELFWYSNGVQGEGVVLQVVERKGNDVVLEDKYGRQFTWYAEKEGNRHVKWRQ